MDVELLGGEIESRYEHEQNSTKIIGVNSIETVENHSAHIGTQLY